MATCTEVLAEFALRQQLKSIPQAALEKTKLMVLDGVGLALAAAREDFVEKTAKALRFLGAGTEATVIGLKDKFPVTSAPLLNGMLIHAFDFDDTHHPLVIHNTSVVMPGALATSEWLGLSGRDFITACAVGFEVSLRVARGPRIHSMHGRGYHPTAVCGVFGGAAAAGRLLGLTHEQLVHAFGLAGSQGSGNMEWQSDGSWSKRFQPGWASHGAVVGALLAREGYTAPRTALEGPRGFYATHVGEDNFDVEAAIGGIGADWELERVEFKPYPCAGALQATVRACINLHNRHHFRPDDIVDVECRLRMGDRPVEEGRERVFSQQLPQGEYGAHFSTPYIAAVALLKGRLTLADFDEAALKDSELLGLSSKIRREDDPNSGRPKYASGHVFVKTKDGKVYEERQHIHPGHIENPVSAEDVQEKYRYNALRLLNETQADSLMKQLITIDELPSVRQLTERLRLSR
ncbi:MAG: MmgE/PrpD family protein [Candidatus Binatia bacterium]